MKRMYSTGAPLPQKLADFFAAISLPVLNIYSLTEAGGCPTVSRLDAHRPGSCGQVAPGFEVRLAQDGEILIQGETIMNEYWGWPPEMGQIFDDEGWLHSGDLGHFDDEGYLYLTGRKQSWMVLSTGRKFIPGTIEQALMANPYIHQAVVFGEGWPYISALIVPDLTVLAQHFQEDEPIEGTLTDNEDTVAAYSTGSLKWFWHPENEDSELMTTTAHPRVKILLDKVVENVNSRLDRWEQIKQYSLVEQAFSPVANELARVMPAGRHLISEKYARQIQGMYPPAPRLEEKEITQVHLSPERMRELLEKEHILDAWLEDAGIEFLFELARTKQIDVPSIVHLCDAAVTIAQMEHEEKPLSTAFIVGDPARIARVLPGSEIQLLRSDHIRRMRQSLITLAQLVDGLVLGYIVDKHGYVRGIRRLRFDRQKYPVAPHPGNRLLGPQFRQRAAISQLCDAMVFFVPTGGRQVRVFADGQLVGRYSNGDWSPDNMARVDEVMDQLVKQKKRDRSLVQRILLCAFQMSEENLGAIFIIGNADDILSCSDAPEISHFALIISADLEELSDRELINFAKQDGATVVDVEGQFRGCMILLRPSAETKADIGPGKGARHSSAAKMSAEARCLAITVSQDGPITIYDSGKRILSL
jgi:DNA integrity scanning protein DisA with diadenylate cyclase activity